MRFLIGIAILSTLGPLLWVLIGMIPMGCCEHKYHCDRLLDYSYGIGVNHIGAHPRARLPLNPSLLTPLAG